MPKRNRIIAVIIALVMVIGSVCSALFVIENSAHKCTGTECQICTQIKSSLETFNNQTPKPRTDLALISIIWIVVLVSGFYNCNVKADTLIDLKIKLSD